MWESAGKLAQQDHGQRRLFLSCQNWLLNHFPLCRSADSMDYNTVVVRFNGAAEQNDIYANN
jgi:hypothetical protein